MATNPVDTDQVELLKFAQQINAVRDARLRGVLIATLILENARLTKDLNLVRAKMGMDPIPTYKPRVR